MASTSGVPQARAACWIRSNSSRHRSSVNTTAALSGICGSDLDVVKARRTGAVPGADYLLGLPFAAIRHAPQDPVVAVGDGLAGIPKFRGDAAVGGILEHPHAPAVVNLPGDLAAELEVVALVIDGPAPVGLHVD